MYEDPFYNSVTLLQSPPKNIQDVILWLKGTVRNYLKIKNEKQILRYLFILEALLTTFGVVFVIAEFLLKNVSNGYKSQMKSSK